MKAKKQSYKKLVICAMMIALGTVLSLWTPFRFWPQGGSVTLAAMAPILFVGLLFGPKWGFGTSFVFSILQLLLGIGELATWGVTPVVFAGAIVFDYLLAYTGLGIASLIPGRDGMRSVVGTILACLFRFLCHFVSGILFFGAFVGEGYTALSWSIFYNGSFMLPEAIVTSVVMLALSRLLKPLRARFA